MKHFTDLSDDQIQVLLQYKTIVDVSNIVSKTDLNGKITYVNEEFCRVSGYSANELIGQSHNVVRHPDMPSHVYKDLWNTILSKKVWKGTIKNKTKNGKPYIVSTTIIPILTNNGEILEFISIRHDVTELMELKEKFKELSNRDYLTRLYNRAFFQNAFQAEYEESNKKGYHSSLLLLDIDNFKEINDTYGHDVGDKFLINFAEQVKEALREEDTFCRVGGDEFAIIISGTTQKAKLVAERIRKRVADHPLKKIKKVTISFGITKIDQQNTLEEIYKKADIALYRAKQTGKDRIELN